MPLMHTEDREDQVTSVALFKKLGDTPSQDLSLLAIDEILEDTIPTVQKIVSIHSPNVIGRWGERFVYHKLMQHYREKYTDCMISETATSFGCIGIEAGQPLKLFFRVFNVGVKTARIEKIKDSAKKLQEGALSLVRATFKP